MSRRSTRIALPLLSALLVFALSIGAAVVAVNQGWLSPFGIDSESQDSQVVNAIERTQEVSLLSLAVQGIRQEKKNSEVFGRRVPGSGEEVLLQYNFDAKLGVDGKDVEVTKTGERSYRVTVPDFKFIGYDQPTFKVIVQGGGLLRGVTPDIDTVEVINRILSSKARDKYLSSNEKLLQDQTKVFYDSLFTSIDPQITTTFEFSD